MGKNKRKNKGQHSQNQSKKKKTNPGQGEKKQPSKTSFELKKPLVNSLYPPPFPKDLPIPKDDFLTYTGKYKESFARAIDTCYEGFAVDKGPSSSNDEKDAIFNNERIEGTLNETKTERRFETVALKYRQVGAVNWSDGFTTIDGENFDLNFVSDQLQRMENNYGYSSLEWNTEYLQQGAYEIMVESECVQVGKYCLEILPEVLSTRKS